MATRPVRKTVTSGLENWDGDMDDNYRALMDTPIPLPEYANAAVLPSASLYEGCVAWIEDEDWPRISRGGSWVPLAPVTEYSTSEQESGLIWTDAATIYKKTINLGALPDTTSKNVAHSISDLDRVIKIEGMADDGTDQIPLPYYHATDGVEVTVNNTNVVLTTEDAKDTFTGYLTIFYLKTS